MPIQNPADMCSADAVNPHGCKIPPAPAATHSVTDFPPCPAPACPTTVPVPAPVLPECVPCDNSPCTQPEPEPKDCCWADEAIESVPPAIPCAPVHVGWGAWDGGFLSWTGLNPKHQVEKCKEQIYRDYGQPNWHHVLDLETNPEHYANLAVWRDGLLQNVTEMEFLALAIKMAQLGIMMGAIPRIDPNKLGIGVVPNGTDGNGKPRYALSTTYDGSPIGTSLPLHTLRDANGDVVGLAFNPAGLA